MSAALVFAACGGGGTPTPRLPLPTRPLPQDAAQATLAEVLTELDYDLDQARSLMQYLAAAPQVRQGNRETCSAFVRQIQANNPQYAQLGAAGADGLLFCDSIERDRPTSVSDRLYFSRALKAQGLVVGEYVVGRVSLLPSVGLAYPLTDDGHTARGILLAPIRLNWLAMRFAEINIPVTGEIVLLDTYGNILVRDPDANDWMGKNISDTQIGQAMLSKVRGAGELRGTDGETRFYAYGSPHGANDQLLVAVGIKK